LLFSCALLLPLLCGRALYWGDITLYFDPMSCFAAESLRSGHVPLWNPYIFCGQPFVGNPQCAFFYPTSALLWLVSVPVYLSLNSFLHVFLCGALTYRFLRRWTRFRLSALAGALVYMGSACVIGRLQFPPMIQTAPYFPLFLSALDACLDAPGTKATLGAAITTALIVLAGHPNLAYLIFVCGAFYGLMRLLATYRQAGNRGQEVALRCLGSGVAGMGLGFLVGAITLLPIAQLVVVSSRERLTEAQANRFTLSSERFLTLLFPRFLGHPASGDYWGGGNAWEPAIFIGWIPLVCIGYAVARRFRVRLVRFWVVATVLATWLAFGNNGGLYQLAFPIVPGLSTFHDPARFLFISTFAAVALTGVGLDAVIVDWKRWGLTSARLALPLIAIPLWWYGVDWNPTTPMSALDHVPATLSALRREPDGAELAAGRAYLADQKPLLQRYIVYRDYGPESSADTAAFLDTLLPNIGMRFGEEAASGYEPVAIRSEEVLDTAASAAFQHGDPSFSRLMDLMGVRVLLLPGSERIEDARFVRLGTSHPTAYRPLAVYANRDNPTRAWIVRRTRRVEGELRTMAALSAPDVRPDGTAILSAGHSEEALDMDAPGDALGTATVVSRSAGRAEIVADVGASPGFLIYSEAAVPGWKATLDGRPVRLYRADCALMGVFVPPGTHRVRFVYAPSAFRVGTYLSLLGVGVLSFLGTLVWGTRLTRRVRQEICSLR
jgi:hypothetical protein